MRTRFLLAALWCWLGGRYKGAEFAASLTHKTRREAGASSVGLGEGAKRDAPIALRHMGHARPRPKRLAEKLLQIREALELSQREMAEQLSERAGVKITNKNVSEYERDKSVPFIQVVLAYARAANVEMAQLVDDDLDLSL